MLNRYILAPLDSGAAGLSLNRSVVKFPSLEVFMMQLDRVVDKLFFHKNFDQIIFQETSQSELLYDYMI